MVETGIRGERDSWLAPALLAVGVAALGYALRMRWNPQEMNPGVEGALTVGIFGPMLLLFEGLSFGDMLKAAVPIWIIQFITCSAVGGPAVAGLGIELCTLGAIGLVLRALFTQTTPAAPAARITRDRVGISAVHSVGASVASSSSAF
jgi:hypothetical protein